MEDWWINTGNGKTEVLGENLSFCHFLYHKPPHRLGCEMPVTSHLIHDITRCLTFEMAIILSYVAQYRYSHVPHNDFSVNDGPHI